MNEYDPWNQIKMEVATISLTLSKRMFQQYQLN
jgi:hypothetical protein